MPDVIELLATGEGDYRLHDPDTFRAWMRDRKRRDLVDKTTVLDGLGIDDVVGEMGVKPRVGAAVERLAPPTALELEILRNQIDPGRTVIGRTAKS